MAGEEGATRFGSMFRSQRFPVLMEEDPYWFTAHDIPDDDK